MIEMPEIKKDEQEYSEDYCIARIRECRGWMPYIDEPWKSQMYAVLDEWYAGNISAYECWTRISELSQEQIHATVTAKSQSNPVSFSDMVSKQRGKNNGLMKEGADGYEYADTSTLNDVMYYAMLCSEEMNDIDKLDGRGVIAFKCDPEEYRQKIIECKKMCDWLVNNITVITYL